MLHKVAGLFVVFSFGVFAGDAVGLEPTDQTATVDFNRDIRPILTARCTSCHGGVREAGGVSFINGEAADPEDGWLVDLDDPDASVLIERITTDDPDSHMPPPEDPAGPLSDSQVDLIRQWIADGAAWSPHWSLDPPQSPAMDPVDSDQKDAATGSAKDGLDVLAARIRRDAGLSASQPAEPQRWLRRASFDLTGLPPSIDQVDQLLAEVERFGRELAFQRAADRLLADPAFGGRWATVWLDLARYADSQGFEADWQRRIWPYRDWVIDSFNRDRPYDEFTVLQLAGDLLSDEELAAMGGPSQLIATAMHRNTMTNSEGGTDDEEFRVAAVIDRVATTWTVWQGTTMGCVQCHSHPYDVYQHEDFYRSLALFNDTADADLVKEYPVMWLPTDGDGPADEEAVNDVVGRQRRLWNLRQTLNDRLASVAMSDVDWTAAVPSEIIASDGQYEVQRRAESLPEVVLTGGATPSGSTIETVFAGQPAEQTITAIRLSILPKSMKPTDWPEQGSVATRVRVHVGDDEVVFGRVIADALTDHSVPEEVLRDNDLGIGGYPKLHRPRWFVFVPERPIVVPPQTDLRIHISSDAKVSGGMPLPIRRLAIETTADDSINDAIESPQSARWIESIAALQQQLDADRESVGGGVELPIMRQRPPAGSRTARMFLRGNWLDRGDEVLPGVPQVFEEDAGPIENRLQFARWLVSPDNPLAARVWVNRVWAELFGVGIVETQEDFGSAGLPPIDGELLDLLAVRLRDDYGWHLKPLLRDLVLSATYRQSAVADSESMEADPANRRLARGPRRRLSAEMVRDAALSSAGLLTRAVGGRPVMPPQPDGVWRSVYNGQSWVDATGANRYRRAVYTYLRRTSPYPSFLSFDAPSREVCTARRVPTNTPLQALVTLNDPVYHEAAAALARRAMNASSASTTNAASKIATDATSDNATDAAIQWMYRTVTSERPPKGIAKLLREAHDHFASEPDADPSDAMTMVASIILNTDEALTR